MDNRQAQAQFIQLLGQQGTQKPGEKLNQGQILDDAAVFYFRINGATSSLSTGTPI
jgi:hypothetical protein